MRLYIETCVHAHAHPRFFSPRISQARLGITACHSRDTIEVTDNRLVLFRSPWVILEGIAQLILCLKSSTSGAGVVALGIRYLSALRALT